MCETKSYRAGSVSFVVGVIEGMHNEITQLCPDEALSCTEIFRTRKPLDFVLVNEIPRGLVIVLVEGKGQLALVHEMYLQAVGIHVVSLRRAGAVVPHPE